MKRTMGRRQFLNYSAVGLTGIGLPMLNVRCIMIDQFTRKDGSNFNSEHENGHSNNAVDPESNTVWAAINHDGDFVARCLKSTKQYGNKSPQGHRSRFLSLSYIHSDSNGKNSS